MKLHLPLSLLHAVMCAVCSFTFATVTLAGGVMALTASYAQAASFDESNHHVEYTKDTVYGGIILSELGAEMTLEGLSSVRLSNNEIVSSRKVYGGVICNYKMGSGAGPVLTMSNNGNITFSGNTVSISAKNVYAYGGVLYNGTSYANTESHASICGNGVVSFTDNAMVLYDGGYGGAIYNLTGTHKLQLNDNEALIFSSNSIRAQGAYGGAIYSAGEAEIIGNGALKFLNNGIDGRVTASYVGDAKGGAIYIDNNGTKDSSSGNTFTYGLTIAKTSSVEFSGNYLISSNSHTNIYGGAICANESELRVVNNGDIVFNGNSITGTGWYLLGGAVYSKWDGESFFTANGNISFLKNSISSLDGADYTYGGAIYHENNMTMSGNKTISFVENFVEGLNSVKGGAVYTGSTSSSSEIFAINDNQGDIIFKENSAKSTANTACGGAVNSTGAMSLSRNHKIEVTNNKAFGSTGAFGGAFYIDKDFGCDYNSGVLFSGNTATAETGAARGGALCVDMLNDLHFLGNEGTILFSGNEAVSSGGNAEGGAIYSDDCKNFTFLLTNGISFSDNKAISETKTALGGAFSFEHYNWSFSGIGDAEFCHNSVDGEQAYGGAVHVYSNGSLSMDHSGDIIFCDNTATARSNVSGGSLRTNGDSILSLSGTNILFSDNTASTDSGNASGGALSSYGGVDMQATNTISYTGNTAVTKAGSAWGGAAVMDNDIHQNPGNLTAGERILFSDNHAIGSQKAQGGALYVRQELTLCETKNITFSGNTAECSSGEAWGGAIHMRWVYPFTMKLTESVLFENNAVLIESGNAYGGAISVDDASTGSAGFNIRDNGVVSFIGNHADSITGNVFGGAIYAKKTITIAGNDNVIFRKNYEKQGDNYHLRSIYVTREMNLSALEGKSISFYDSLYSGAALTLNKDYTDSDGGVHASTGSIIFSGKYTDADLKEIKGGIAGTAEEILNSRASSINGILTLNNGRLQVEDQAVLTATRFVAKAGTTVALDNASLVSTSTSTTSSTNTLTDCSLVLTNGGALTLGGRLTLSGKVTLDVSGYALGSHTLIAANGVVGADLLDISYTEGEREVYDIVWNEKKTALTLTVTKRARTEPLTHLWTSGFEVLGDGQALGDEEFMQGDTLQFNEAAAVIISGTVKPAAIVVDTAGDVSFIDDSETPGNIAGACSLSKDGSGKLTISTANTYTGGTTLNGGTLEVANAHALGSGAVTMTGGTLSGTLSGTTIQASGGDITAELTGSNSITGANFALSRALRNSGTLSLSGSFSADNLELRHSDATRVDVNGSFGAAGFAKAAFDAVTVVNGGSVINKGATVTHGSLSLELGSDGVATRGGTVDLSEYLLVNGTAAASSAIHAKSATASVTMNGGTLTADDAVQVTATGGALILNGGSLSGTLNNVTLTMTNGSLNTSLGGSSTLIGNHYTLTKALSNTGTLRVSGSLDASALNLNTTGITHVDVNGVSGASGFTKYGDSSVTLITGGTVVNEGALITHGNLSLTLGSDGVARTAGATVYDTYLLTTGASVTSSSVHAKAAGASITQTGGTLTVNDTATVNATAGDISLSGGTLNGTLSGTSVTATGGTLAATLNGKNTLTGQSYAVQSAISNRGTLTVSGSFDASALTLNTIAATHVDVNGKSGASGFAKEADHYVTLVNGGTVINQGAIVTHGGLQLTLAADGTAKSTGATDDSLYLLTGRDSVSTSAVHAKSAGAAVSMTGGTLTVNDRAMVSATAGEVNLNGGTLVGSLATSNDLRLNVQQTSSMEGSLTLGGGVLSLVDTLTLNGILSVSGDTELDIRSYTKVGDYTLIRAAGITGDLSMLSYVPPTRQFGYTLSHSDNDLKLIVSRLSENLVWTLPKGILDGRTFAEGDTLEVTAPASITLSGAVKQGGVTVSTAGKVTFTADKKTPGSGLVGDGSLMKNGAGLLTMNAGNSYTGGTVLNAGTIKATAADSFGTGAITVKGGTLDLGSKAVANDIVLSGEATIKGDAKYVGNVTVEGDATLLAKASYKGMTTLGSGSTLTLAPKATMAGSITLDGGTLNISAPKGMTLAKNMTMQLNGGSVSGLLTIGTGSTLVWQDGLFETSAPVLKGGTVVLGGENALTLTGSKAQVQFGDKVIDLPGKGTVRTDEALTVNIGTVTVNSMGGYEGELAVNSGTLKLATGKVTTENNIVLNGTAAVVNGGTHYGDITVDGLLAKGTTIKLLNSEQRVTLNGSGVMLGAISGAGIVDVRGDVDITGAKLTNASILLGGTLTHAKGLTLAKGQTLTLDGGFVNGILTIGAGAVLDLNGHTLTTAPVLKGGTYDDGGSHTLTLTGAKADISLGEQAVSLLSKSFIKSDAALTVNSGTVTVNDFGTSDQAVTITGGTLKLSTGKQTSRNTIVVNGTAAVVNGATHYGDIEVNGELAKGTSIKLLTADQRVVLKGGETLLGAISGAGIIDVNASIDATAAKLTAATININSGCTFTNTKGIKLAKGQTLNLTGASLELGTKGVLATVAGSTLGVSGNNTLTGSLTLGGGELVFSEGGTLTLDGTLTLSKPVTVTGSGSITYDTLKPIKGELSAFFGDAEVKQDGNTILIKGSAPALRMAATPLATAAEAPAPLDAAPAIPVVNPVADAMVQADWGILDAERAFMGAVNSRSQHATLLDKGRGAAWVSAFGASVRHGNQGTHHGSDGSIEGAAFGLEHAVSETGTLGLAVGRSKNRIAATGVTHLRQETAHVALYGQKQLKHGFTADAAATYGDTETKLGAASWTQKSAALTARLTHATLLSDATAFRTFGGLSYEATDAGSIATVHTGSVQNLRAELGAGATHTLGKAHLYAEAALTGDMVRHNPTADFGGVRTHGANPGRLGIRATVGGIYAFSDTWSGTASYGIEAESRSTAHTLNIGVSKSF